MLGLGLGYLVHFFFVYETHWWRRVAASSVGRPQIHSKSAFHQVSVDTARWLCVAVPLVWFVSGSVSLPLVIHEIYIYIYIYLYEVTLSYYIHLYEVTLSYYIICLFMI